MTIHPVSIATLLEGGQTITRKRLYGVLGPKATPYLGEGFSTINKQELHGKIAVVAGILLLALGMALVAALGGPRIGYMAAGVVGAVVLSGGVVFYRISRTKKETFLKEELDWAAVIKELVPIYHRLVQKLEKNPKNGGLKKLVDRFQTIEAIEHEGALQLYVCKTPFGGFVADEKGIIHKVILDTNSHVVTDAASTIGGTVAKVGVGMMAKAALTYAATTAAAVLL